MVKTLKSCGSGTPVKDTQDVAPQPSKEKDVDADATTSSDDYEVFLIIRICARRSFDRYGTRRISTSNK